jgi:hypothetical protein
VTHRSSDPGQPSSGDANESFIGDAYVCPSGLSAKANCVKNTCGKTVCSDGKSAAAVNPQRKESRGRSEESTWDADYSDEYWRDGHSPKAPVARRAPRPKTMWPANPTELGTIRHRLFLLPSDRSSSARWAILRPALREPVGFVRVLREYGLGETK